MALDFMAIVSSGAYPTPTPTATQRAAYAVSYGLLNLVPAGTLGGWHYWINIMGWPWRKIWKSWG